MKKLLLLLFVISVLAVSVTAQDLNLTFEDDADLVNWGLYDGPNGSTNKTWDATAGVAGSGAFVFGDGGYQFTMERPIVATTGTDYSLTIDLKTIGWDAASTWNLDFSVVGIGDSVGVSIMNLPDFTAITLTGTATSGSGYIKIQGFNTAATNVGGTIAVTIDNLVFDDDVQPPASSVLINEFDTKTSSLEFLELYNTTAAPIDLAAGGYVLVFVNGSDDELYTPTDLTGTIPANGFYVIAEAGVTDIGGYTPDQNGTWTSFQDGQDGVVLVSGAAASDFPSDEAYDTLLTAVPGALQEDAIIYGGVVDTGLEAQFNLLAGTLVPVSSSGSSARATDGQGGAAYANADWEIAAIRTPGSTNEVAGPTYIPYTILEIQTPDAGGDTTQYLDEYVETSGIITALTSYSFYMQDGIEDYSGIYVYVSGDVSGYALGDDVTVQGVASEYYSFTQISSIADITVNSSGNALPAPIVLITNTLSEGHEGMLVTISGECTAVSTNAGGDYWAFKLDDGSGDALVDDQVFSDAENSATVGSTYDVVGVVNYYHDAFTVNPRDLDDVVDNSIVTSSVLINEFDTKTSSLEFLELYNTTAAPIDLAAGGYVLVFVNGSDDELYTPTDLTGTIPANGFYVIAEAGVTDIGGYTPDQNGTWTSFQDGQDGVVLVSGAAASDFPSDEAYDTLLTAVPGALQEDAIIYGGVVDTGLEAQFNLLAGTLVPVSSSGSSARATDGQGGAAYANADWEIAAIRTPGSTNEVAGPTYIPYTILEIQTPDAGGDTTQYLDEYVETSGIITALTSYSFYMQDGIEDYSGIYVYVSGDVSGYALGDDVTVQGVASEYYSFTQISSIADITVNSSGNALPAPIVLITNTLSEGHEGMLVTISGECTAVSTNAGGDYWAFKLDDGSGDALVDDQVFSDAENSATVGSTYDVVGVVNYYHDAFTVNPRDLDDIVDVSPTVTIASAFSISDIEIEVIYSGDMTAVDVADYSLLGTAGVTFTSATIDAANAKLVHLVASAAITGDAILDTLVDAALTDTLEMYAGVTPIAFTNALNPGGTIELGITATFAGLVTANDAYNNVWVSDGGNAYMGVLVYDYDFQADVAVGDEIMFTGELDVYNNLSELKSATLLGIASSGNATTPALIAGSDIDSSLAADTNPGEQWEGQLVKIAEATVLSYNSTDYYYVLSDDEGVTTFLVGDNVDYHLGVVSLTVGSVYDIVGVIDWDVDELAYALNPRDMNDVMEVVGVAMDGVLPAEYALSQNYPNPFNPTTTIEYALPEMSDVSFIIYNIRGQKIREIALSSQPAGFYNYTWNGTDAQGIQVSTGVYLYAVRAGNYVETRKMLYLK